jgi:hypothetical protein
VLRIPLNDDSVALSPGGRAVNPRGPSVNVGAPTRSETLAEPLYGPFLPTGRHKIDYRALKGLAGLLHALSGDTNPKLAPAIAAATFVQTILESLESDHLQAETRLSANAPRHAGRLSRSRQAAPDSRRRCRATSSHHPARLQNSGQRPRHRSSPTNGHRQGETTPSRRPASPADISSTTNEVTLPRTQGSTAHCAYYPFDCGATRRVM